MSSSQIESNLKQFEQFHKDMIKNIYPRERGYTATKVEVKFLVWKKWQNVGQCNVFIGIQQHFVNQPRQQQKANGMGVFYIPFIQKA